MKIAVFSDVHGNLNALKSVLKQIEEKKVDQTIFLGDIFQRGNEEMECLDYFMNSDVICMKGNCELYAVNGVDIDPDVEYLRKYYDEIKNRLTDGQMEFIRKMPLFHEIECFNRKLFFSHFLFSDINRPYPFLQLADLKNGIFDMACKNEVVTKYDLVAIGHSHSNFVKYNVVSVSATGLEGASYLLISVDEEGIKFEHINID